LTGIAVLRGQTFAVAADDRLTGSAVGGTIGTIFFRSFAGTITATIYLAGPAIHLAIGTGLRGRLAGPIAAAVHRTGATIRRTIGAIFFRGLTSAITALYILSPYWGGKAKGKYK